MYILHKQSMLYNFIVLKSFLGKTYNIKQIYLAFDGSYQKNSVYNRKITEFLCNNKTLIKILIK